MEDGSFNVLASNAVEGVALWRLEDFRCNSNGITASFSRESWSYFKLYQMIFHPRQSTKPNMSGG